MPNGGSLSEARLNAATKPWIVCGSGAGKSSTPWRASAPQGENSGDL